MCWIFCKTVTYEYWNVVNTPLTDPANPDGFHKFAELNELLTGVPYSVSREYLDVSAGKKTAYRRLANKLSDGFYTGFGDMAIGMNVFPTDIVKAILNPSNPDAVTIVSKKLVPLDYTEWVTEYLTDNYNYSTTTGLAVNDGVTFSVDPSTADSVTNTVVLHNEDTNTDVTIRLPAEPIGDTLIVKYQTEVRFGTSTKTWVYDIGSGKHPELDLFTQIPDKDPTNFKLFPPLVIRSSNDNYPNFTTPNEYDEYAKALSIDPEAILEAFSGLNDQELDQLDDIAIMHGVNLQSVDKHSLRYCADFVEKLVSLLDTYPTSLYDSETIVAFRNVVNDTSGTYFLSPLLSNLINKQQAPAIELGCEFHDFAYTLRFTGVNKATISAATIAGSSALTNLVSDLLNSDPTEYGQLQGSSTIYGKLETDGLAPLVAMGIPWTNADEYDAIREYSGEIGTTFSDKYISNNVITYFRYSLVTNDLECFTLVNPITTSIVTDGRTNRTHTVLVNLHSEDAEIYFPLDWRIIENYPSQTFTTVVSNSVYLEMQYAYFKQEKVWNWKLITFAIAIVTFQYYLVEFGTIGAAITAGTAAMVGTLTALGLSITLAYIVLGVMALSALGVFGDEAQYVAAAFFAIMGFAGNANATLGLNKATLQLAATGIDIMNKVQMKDISDEMDALARAEQILLQDVEDASDALSEFMEEIGYYKRKEDKKWVATSLLNFKQVAELTPQLPKKYIDEHKSKTDIRAYFNNVFTYSV